MGFRINALCPIETNLFCGPVAPCFPNIVPYA